MQALWFARVRARLAVLTQQAKRMHRIILSYVISGWPCFSTLSHRWHGFRKKSLNIKCVFWFSLQILSEIFLIPRKMNRDIVIDMKMYSCKVSVILAKFELNSNFLYTFSKKLKYQVSAQFIKWEPSYFKRTDGETDMTKLIAAFCNSSNAPKVFQIWITNPLYTNT
jgi:hypothetical protein